MEISPSRITTQALMKTAGFSFQTETRRCERHGEYMSMKSPAGWSECIECTKAARKLELHQAEQKASIESSMRKACIPARFATRTLETFEAHNDGAARAYRIAEAYSGDFASVLAAGRALVFCGNVGTGKTHLAIGIIHRVMGMRHTARYGVLIDAIRAVKETWGRSSTTTEAEVLAGYTAPDLLVLDEVGVQFGSDSEKLILFSIVNARYNQMKPTIIISNLARDGLTEYLGDRVADRLREGGGRMVPFDWESHRSTIE